MNHDRERSDVVAATRGADTSLGMDDEVGATIQLWRAPNRVWPAVSDRGCGPGRIPARPGPGPTPEPCNRWCQRLPRRLEGGRHLAQADQGVPGLTWGTFLESALPKGLAAIKETPCSSGRGRGEAVCLFAERVRVALHPARHSQRCRCNGTLALCTCSRLGARLRRFRGSA